MATMEFKRNPAIALQFLRAPTIEEGIKSIGHSLSKKRDEILFCSFLSGRPLHPDELVMAYQQKLLELQFALKGPDAANAYLLSSRFQALCASQISGLRICVLKTTPCSFVLPDGGSKYQYPIVLEVILSCTHYPHLDSQFRTFPCINPSFPSLGALDSLQVLSTQLNHQLDTVQKTSLQMEQEQEAAIQSMSMQEAFANVAKTLRVDVPEIEPPSSVKVKRESTDIVSLPTELVPAELLPAALLLSDKKQRMKAQDLFIEKIITGTHVPLGKALFEGLSQFQVFTKDEKEIDWQGCAFVVNEIVNNVDTPKVQLFAEQLKLTKKRVLEKMKDVRDLEEMRASLKDEECDGDCDEPTCSKRRK